MWNEVLLVAGMSAVSIFIFMHLAALSFLQNVYKNDGNDKEFEKYIANVSPLIHTVFFSDLSVLNAYDKKKRQQRSRSAISSLDDVPQVPLRTIQINRILATIPILSLAVVYIFDLFQGELVVRYVASFALFWNIVLLYNAWNMGKELRDKL